MSHLSRPARVAGALLVAAVSLVTAASVSTAQTGGPVASGEFVGAIAVTGGFSVAAADVGADTGIEFIALVDGSGPLELTLSEGTMVGSWSIAGTQALRINTPSGEADGSFSGDGTFTGTGQMSGPPGNYTPDGSVASTNTVTFGAAGFTQTVTSDDTTEFQQTLTDVVVLCQQIYGRWDLETRQGLDEAGFNEFIRGYFSASTGIDATEQAAEIQLFLEDVTDWAQGVGDVTAENRSLFIGRALSILDAVEGFQAELAAPSPCPPDPRFATSLTLAAQDALARLVAEVPGITNSRIVTLALRSGAIGAGSALPAAAAALEAQLQADVQQRWDDLLANYPAISTDADLLENARTAQLLGMDSLGEVSPAEAILVISGESS